MPISIRRIINCFDMVSTPARAAEPGRALRFTEAGKLGSTTQCKHSHNQVAYHCQGQLAHF
jgi:hypothetical protein